MENLVVYSIMGFEKRYLPDLETIKHEYCLLGHEEFIRRISRYEALIGPNESQSFIQSILAEDRLKKFNSSCITSQK